MAIWSGAGTGTWDTQLFTTTAPAGATHVQVVSRLQLAKRSGVTTYVQRGGTVEIPSAGGVVNIYQR